MTWPIFACACVYAQLFTCSCWPHQPKIAGSGPASKSTRKFLSHARKVRRRGSFIFHAHNSWRILGSRSQTGVGTTRAPGAGTPVEFLAGYCDVKAWTFIPSSTRGSYRTYSKARAPSALRARLAGIVLGTPIDETIFLHHWSLAPQDYPGTVR